ncbi:MAG TPA: hypothetical protein VKM96_02520 [Candidatus Bathyarchaeia archaeon]|nr:hypothetical protein [Candidatus Bathyarchaeia archaeon]
MGMLSLGLFFIGLGLGKTGSPFSYPLQAWGFALALYFPAARMLRNSKSRPTVRGLLKLSIALLVAGSVLATAASSAQVLDQPNLTVIILDSIALEAYILGVAGELFSYALLGPSYLIV